MFSASEQASKRRQEAEFEKKKKPKKQQQKKPKKKQNGELFCYNTGCLFKLENQNLGKKAVVGVT